MAVNSVTPQPGVVTQEMLDKFRGGFVVMDDFSAEKIFLAELTQVSVTPERKLAITLGKALVTHNGKPWRLAEEKERSFGDTFLDSFKLICERPTELRILSEQTDLSITFLIPGHAHGLPLQEA
jgi:hypothetical protein